MNQLQYKDLWDSYEGAVSAACFRSDYVHAQLLLQTALKEAEDLGEIDPCIVHVSDKVVRHYFDMQMYEHAESICFQLLETLEKVSGQDDPYLVKTKSELVKVWKKQGKLVNLN